MKKKFFFFFLMVIILISFFYYSIICFFYSNNEKSRNIPREKNIVLIKEKISISRIFFDFFIIFIFLIVIVLVIIYRISENNYKKKIANLKEDNETFIIEEDDEEILEKIKEKKAREEALENRFYEQEIKKEKQRKAREKELEKKRKMNFFRIKERCIDYGEHEEIEKSNLEKILYNTNFLDYAEEYYIESEEYGKIKEDELEKILYNINFLDYEKANIHILEEGEINEKKFNEIRFSNKTNKILEIGIDEEDKFHEYDDEEEKKKLYCSFEELIRIISLFFAYKKNNNNKSIGDDIIEDILRPFFNFLSKKGFSFYYDDQVNNDNNEKIEFDFVNAYNNFYVDELTINEDYCNYNKIKKEILKKEKISQQESKYINNYLTLNFFKYKECQKFSFSNDFYKKCSNLLNEYNQNNQK